MLAETTGAEVHQTLSDHVATDHEEHVDSDVATREASDAGVVEHHEDHGESAHSLDVGTEV